MSRTFELPDPGEGIHEAEVVAIHVGPDDTVSESDVLLEVETDKARVDVTAPFSGRIVELLVEEGDDVRVGEGILTWEPQDGEAETGDEDAADQDDKDDEDEEKPEDGEKREDGEDGEDGEDDRDDGKPEDDQKRETDRQESRTDSTPVPAAPSTRRLARELGVELDEIQGSGPEGRVTDDDVRRASEDHEASEEDDAPGERHGVEAQGEVEEAEAEAEAEPEEEAEEPADRSPSQYGDPEKWGPVEREPLRSIRRTVARRMADAWRRIPHVTHVDHADITELEALRTEHDDAVDDVDLTLTVFVLKALVAALKEFPRFNARLDQEAGEIVLLRYHHIGVAVDTEWGLMVPVVRDVDSRSLMELARELADLTGKAREREITRDRMQGGSFTLTNPGPLGGDFFTPIINPPQVAILGLGRAELRPVVREGAEEGPRVEPGLILPICLAFDHRVNDGADAARFTGHLIELLEDPDSFIRHL